MTIWNLQYLYCTYCRNEAQLKNSQVKCDEENLCNRVLSWEDEEGYIHKEPFQLLPQNHLALEMYFERILPLSDYQSISWQKGTGKSAKQYEATVKGLSSMEFVLEYFLPPDTTVDELDLLIQKIVLIHSIRMGNVIGT